MWAVKINGNPAGVNIKLVGLENVIKITQIFFWKNSNLSNFIGELLLLSNLQTQLWFLGGASE